MNPPIIEIHTSDRQLYKRCRRKFDWASTLRQNLTSPGPEPANFFLGTGFHFALEDWWGYRMFSHPALAFAAYYDAHKKDDLPDEADELLDLATGMLSYYVEDWLEEHPEPWQTLIVDGKPQVEVEVAVDITDILLDYAYSIMQREWLEDILASEGNEAGPARVVYVTTYDRVVWEPKHEIILGLDYKTAAQFDELNLQTNPQAGAYDWSMALFYQPAGYEPGGIVWQQHKKVVPEPPRLVNGKGKDAGMVLSLDQRQQTTYRIYKRSLIEQYGHMSKVPEKYLGFLADLGNRQDDEGDHFIRRQVLRRNQVQREVEQTKIVAEVLEMLDPDLPLYPNPTKDCAWDCAFKSACLAMDDGSDYQYFLDGFTPWAGYKDDWRARVKYPAA